MKTIYQSINFTFLLLLAGLSSSLFAADPLFANQGGLDSLYYIFIIGMALVLLFVSKTLFVFWGSFEVRDSSAFCTGCHARF